MCPCAPGAPLLFSRPPSATTSTSTRAHHPSPPPPTTSASLALGSAHTASYMRCTGAVPALRVVRPRMLGPGSWMSHTVRRATGDPPLEPCAPPSRTSVSKQGACSPVLLPSHRLPCDSGLSARKACAWEEEGPSHTGAISVLSHPHTSPPPLRSRPPPSRARAHPLTSLSLLLFGIGALGSKSRKARAKEEEGTKRASWECLFPACGGFIFVGGNPHAQRA